MSKVDLSEVMATGTFNLEEAESHPYGPKSLTILKIMCQRQKSMVYEALFTASRTI